MVKIYTPKILLAFFISLLFSPLLFTSCEKADDGKLITGTYPDLITQVKSSVSGFVTDENDQAVNLATVQLGAATITTDKYGYFEATNVDVVKEAAVVTVSKTGYFKGIKTYMAEEGKSAFFRIKLIRKITVGTVNAAAGGAVTLANGLSITLPANAVVNATTNAAYTGAVNVAAYWINPTAPDLSSTMPGDLRGINTNGNIQLLTTYGMVAVELTGSGGELLQIATGKKATLSLPIPSSLSSSAPATIPLWYFDEAKGLWKEEGTATKTGNNYVGEVSHFSFWNWDVPGNYVQFNCTLLNTFGQPAAFTSVKITQISNPANFRYGTTNLNGYVAGPVPANSQLLFEVLAGSPCYTVLYSQTFTTSNINISLGNIIVNTVNNVPQATISGTITTCANTPVTNGYIIFQNGFYNYRYPVTNGSYNFTTFLCSVPITISIIAEDAANGQQSNSSNYSIIPGNNIIPNIQACVVNTQQLFSYTINGTPYTFTSPVDTFYRIPHPVAGWAWMGAQRIPTNNSDYIGIIMDNTGITNGSTQNLIDFRPFQIPQGSTIPNPIGINITEFGLIGQFLSGNFSGLIVGPAPNNAQYNVTCSFRIRRNF